jgi:hypothetical protein
MLCNHIGNGKRTTGCGGFQLARLEFNKRLFLPGTKAISTTHGSLFSFPKNHNFNPAFAINMENNAHPGPGAYPITKPSEVKGLPSDTNLGPKTPTSNTNSSNPKPSPSDTIKCHVYHVHHRGPIFCEDVSIDCKQNGNGPEIDNAEAGSCPDCPCRLVLM